MYYSIVIRNKVGEKIMFSKQNFFKKTFITFSAIGVSFGILSSNVEAAPNPSAYLATLQFDGTDWMDTGEKNFPHAFRFQSYDNDIEHNKENEIRFKIGNAVTGIGSTGLTNRGPNNQQPAVYFHIAKKGEYEIYEYWLYYADNDWINNHEHDWEKYFVYLKNGVPTHLLISSHNGYKIKPWAEVSKDDGHPLIGVDGGAHAMKWDKEDGVQIRYNGDITKNNGRLDEGDQTNQPWILYSNDPIDGVTKYVAAPDTFYYGDPAYLLYSNEHSDSRQAPWKREEWDNPPFP